MGTELSLSDTLAHGSCGRDTTADGLDQVVVVVGTGPVLMGQGLDIVDTLLALNAVDVSVHALVSELASKDIDTEGVAVESCKGDELPREAELAEVADESAHVVVVHASSIPVEGRRQVVGK